MGIADSPLRERVLFVEGAPRSGTTWVTALLATHSEIAGTASESHLFDHGVGALFANQEEGGWGTWLAAYVSGDELTDLVRDLCDGVLLRMLERMKPEATIVVEKSPLFSAQARSAIERKLRCYPDASYLHIVRNEEATARSVLRAPFSSIPSEAAAVRGVREAVDAIRAAASDHPRYLEVRHEEVQADPVERVAAIIRWLGLTDSEAVRERIRRLSEERFSRLESRPPRRPGLAPILARGRHSLSRGRRALSARTDARASAGLALGNRLIVAARDGDADAVRDLTTHGFSIEVRAATADVIATGDEARLALLDVGRRLLAGLFVTVEWLPADGMPFVSYLFHAIDGDASRVDASLHLFPVEDRIGRLTIISAGDLAGRPFSAWSRRGPTT